MGVISTVFFDR